MSIVVASDIAGTCSCHIGGFICRLVCLHVVDILRVGSLYVCRLWIWQWLFVVSYVSSLLPRVLQVEWFTPACFLAVSQVVFTVWQDLWAGSALCMFMWLSFDMRAWHMVYACHSVGLFLQLLVQWVEHLVRPHHRFPPLLRAQVPLLEFSSVHRCCSFSSVYALGAQCVGLEQWMPCWAQRHFLIWLVCHIVLCILDVTEFGSELPCLIFYASLC